MNNPVILFDYNSRLLPAAHRRSRYRPAAGKRLPDSPVCQGYAEAGQRQGAAAQQHAGAVHGGRREHHPQPPDGHGAAEPVDPGHHLRAGV